MHLSFHFYVDNKNCSPVRHIIWLTRAAIGYLVVTVGNLVGLAESAAAAAAAVFLGTSFRDHD